MHYIRLPKHREPKIEAKILPKSFVIVDIGEQSPIPTSNPALQPDLFTALQHYTQDSSSIVSFNGKQIVQPCQVNR